MDGSLFDGLENCEANYPLPNGKHLKIVSLDLSQRVDVHNRLKSVKKGDTGSQLELHKHVMKLAVVNDNYESYLDDKTVNRLARVCPNAPTEIFAKVMELTAADPASTEQAKKK